MKADTRFAIAGTASVAGIAVPPLLLVAAGHEAIAAFWLVGCMVLSPVWAGLFARWVGDE